MDIFSLGSTESFDFRQLVINEASNGTFDFRSNDLKPNQRETDFQLSHLKPDHRYRLTILAIDRRSRAGTDLKKQFYKFLALLYRVASLLKENIIVRSGSSLDYSILSSFCSFSYSRAY